MVLNSDPLSRGYITPISPPQNRHHKFAFPSLELSSCRLGLSQTERGVTVLGCLGYSCHGSKMAVELRGPSFGTSTSAGRWKYQAKSPQPGESASV